ncbi:hypothetical protein SADUNF_Sadunf02G0014600 [Salix dunnii]|uniref:PCI domain-containing protein n=1 Tax=Salix dunnii TaxID=1413687 RepID=A0A835N5J1_9ROSI|nr:hypothetical protein SADUNF_Sadunf02G0014600 [Salix dunnii]
MILEWKLILQHLLQQNAFRESLRFTAKVFSSAAVARVKNLSRGAVATAGVLASRVCGTYDIRNLLHLLAFSTLHHDDLGQETLLNLLLRNYLHYNFYDQAEKLRSKALRFQSHTIQQRAPVSAHGFQVLCNKWAVLVHLLLGEIPERTIFTQSGMERDLRPYFMLTNVSDFSSNSDKTYNLIVRLRHNVIRTGLRKISMSYSRISLADVAEKLKLDSANPVEDVESIAAKAIRDGAIHAILDHANGWLEDEEADSAMSVCTKESSLELEFYSYFLVLIFLIVQKRYNEAKVCSLNGIARVMNLNMAEPDFVSVLAARLYFYYSYSYEVSGDLAEIRRNLLDWYSVAASKHDELGQETLLNLLLRNYLHYNLYEQAEKLRSKAPKIQSRSNKQTLRYLFYTGKIQTIQLAYTDAKESFQQAVLRAPVAARGFRIHCSKWAVLARLLLGEKPEKTIFMQSGMERALRPYFKLTNALRISDLKLFGNVAEMFSGTFVSDRTKNVIVRLQNSVTRNGLCNISISYSRISLAEVANKLKLHYRNLLSDVENIVAKAIHDGAINGKIDHANGWLISKETRDIYATAEPQAAFSSRIAFYLNLYNETVRASHFPSDNDMHENRRSASQVSYGEVLEQLEVVRDRYFKK